MLTPMTNEESTQSPVQFISAILLLTREPDRLVRFYRDVLGIPLEPEVHDGSATHFACELGDTHFAIHDAAEVRERSESFKLAFAVTSLDATIAALQSAGVQTLYPPKSTGFAVMTAVLDPDANYIELTELSDAWLQYLVERRNGGKDPVAAWASRRGGA